MSCARQIPWHHLTVDSAVAVTACSMQRGTSAVHKVRVRNYAAVDVEVQLTCTCPDPGELSYSCGKSWSDTAPLDAMGIGGAGNTTFDFRQDLVAAPGGSGSASEQVHLAVDRRRPLTPPPPWKRFGPTGLPQISLT